MSENKPMVLIVEDEILSQTYYSHILQDHFEVHMVSNVADAKQALKEHEFTVAIIDISLPGEDNGLDLIKHLVKNIPEKPYPITISAHAFQNVREEALEAGAVEFFSKPVLSGILLDVVKKYASKADAN